MPLSDENPVNLKKKKLVLPYFQNDPGLQEDLEWMLPGHETRPQCKDGVYFNSSQ